MANLIQRIFGLSANVVTTQTVQILDNTISVQQMYRTKKDIQDWRQAIRSWESVLNPLRKQLLEIYNLCTEDSFVSEMLDRRIRNVCNSRIEVFKDGEIQPELNEMFNGVWFRDFVKYAIESKFYGHSLIELQVKDGQVQSVELIPRHHVRPELGIITRNNYAENQGINYRETPFSNFLVEVGHRTDKGLLWKAFPQVITKRGSFIDWGQHSELFGMPIRVFTYDPMQPNARNEAEAAAKNAGSASYIVVPKGTGLELHKGAENGTSAIYDDLRNACNDEIGMLICGENLKDGQSYKESEVKQTKFEEIKTEDKLFIEYVLNWELKPKLEALGYDLKDCNFAFNQTQRLSLEKRIDIDLKVGQNVVIPDEYWYETYSIPMPKDGITKPEKQATPAVAEKKKLSDLYESFCCGQHIELDDTQETQEFADLLQKLAELVFAGKLTLDNFVRSKTYQTLVQKYLDKLFSGFEQGYGKLLAQLEVGSPDYVFLSKIKQSQAIFSAHKAAKLIEELNNLLLNGDKTISKADFIREALKLNPTWNKIWFEAEYRTAIQSAIHARQWEEIQADKALFPLLTYRTVGDSNVRPEHAILDGIIRPVDDKFWNDYFPPNGWSCRCTVLKKGSWETPTPDTVLTTILKTPISDIPSEFKNNVGKTGQIFSNSHPYYDVSKDVESKINKKYGNP